MTLVRNTLLRPGQSPAQARARVSIALRPPGFWLASSPPPTDFEIAGAFRPNVGSTGLWTVDLVPTDSISPAGSFYEVREQVDDMFAVWPFIVPGSVAFTGGSRTSNVVTLTGLAVGHGIQPGDIVTVTAADSTYNGTFTVTGPAIPGTTITYAQTAGNDASSGAGTLTKTWDLAELAGGFTATWAGEHISYGGLPLIWLQPAAEPLATTVQSTVTAPGGLPLWDRVRLDLRLRGGGFWGAPGQREVLGTERILVDSTGHWQRDLVPNSAIEPGGSYYELTETVGDEVTVRRFEVPAAFQVNISSRTSNVVTLTLNAPPAGLVAGDQAIVNLADATYDGTFVINAPVGNVVTYTQTAGNDTDGGTGTLTKVWDLAELV
jgi:hypothetical protein